MREIYDPHGALCSTANVDALEFARGIGVVGTRTFKALWLGGAEGVHAIFGSRAHHY